MFGRSKEIKQSTPVEQLKNIIPKIIPVEPTVDKLEKNEPASYHQMKAIILKETTIVDENGVEKEPEIGFTKTNEEAKINFELNDEPDLFQIFSILSKTIDKLEINNVDMDMLFLYSKDSKTRIIIHGKTFYAKARIEFNFKKEINDNEIEGIVKTYKFVDKLKEKENNPQKKEEEVKNPKQVLSELGATVFNPEDAPNWDFLAGYEKAKQQVKDTVILPLLHPEVFDQIARMTRKNYQSIRPKAVLFEGPPGTGKTTMARLIAGETKSNLVYVPVETIMSKWYGESEKNLGNIFNACESLDNCVLFLDEIDSLATSRDGNMHEATRRILSVLLRKIDGFNQNKGTILIGATNRKDDLDSALLSRFNTSIEFALPNIDERKAIIANYAQHLDDEELFLLAEKTEGKSGRDIKNLCERVERSWASKLITQGSIDSIEVPKMERYLTECE